MTWCHQSQLFFNLLLYPLFYIFLDPSSPFDFTTRTDFRGWNGLSFGRLAVFLRLAVLEIRGGLLKRLIFLIRRVGAFGQSQVDGVFGGAGDAFIAGLGFLYSCALNSSTYSLFWFSLAGVSYDKFFMLLPLLKASITTSPCWVWSI